MAQKVLLFNYFLHQVAERVQKQCGLEEKAALLSIIFSKANIFRRYASGGASQLTWSCHPQYAEDLFWTVLLNAKANGEDLLRYYQPRASFLFGGQKQWGAPILEDADIQAVCAEIYPKAAPDHELYAKVLGEETLPKIDHAKSVDVSKLELPTPDADTAAIDRALARLCEDAEFIKLFGIESKYDFYGRSLAHKYYATHYATLIPAV